MAARTPKPTPSPRKPGRRAGRVRDEDQMRLRARRLADGALAALGEIMSGDGQDSVRLAAAREVLDRGYGRTRLGGPEGRTEAAPYTVVVQQVGDPPDPGLEDFD